MFLCLIYNGDGQLPEICENRLGNKTASHIAHICLHGDMESLKNILRQHTHEHHTSHMLVDEEN